MGSVLIWHMYWPPSSSCTCLICKFHVEWSVCDTDTRGLCVTTRSWMAWMALVSAFTHPICQLICKLVFLSIGRISDVFFKLFCIPCILRGAPRSILKWRLCPLILFDSIKVHWIQVYESYLKKKLYVFLYAISYENLFTFFAIYISSRVYIVYITCRKSRMKIQKSNLVKYKYKKISFERDHIFRLKRKPQIKHWTVGKKGQILIELLRMTKRRRFRIHGVDPCSHR